MEKVLTIHDSWGGSTYYSYEISSITGKDRDSNREDMAATYIVSTEFFSTYWAVLLAHLHTPYLTRIPRSATYYGPIWHDFQKAKSGFWNCFWAYFEFIYLFSKVFSLEEK